MHETHLLESRQTVKLGLIKVIEDLFPGETLKTAYSIQTGVFCRLSGSVLSHREVNQISSKLQEWVTNESPIQLLYQKEGYYHYKVDQTIVKTIYPANTQTSQVEPFRIVPFSSGFIVDFYGPDERKDQPLILPKKLSATYEKSQWWLKNIDLELVSDVNRQITSGHSLELLSIAEALQEKEISDIADMILQQRRAVRVVLISGPSSSGKTTFSHRLSTHLRVNGLKPIPLSLDDYFVDREQTPRDENGNYDFDCLEALDLPLLHQQIEQLINGEAIETPTFDFASGTRAKTINTMQLGPSEILVIEGIHALSPGLAPSINSNVFFKIYVSALFELNIDLMNRVPTTEVRLIRRMVRDDNFRGLSPEKTFNQWDSVRRGEDINVFKFQEESDVMFNSSLLYEMNALRPFAEISLQKIHDESPHFHTKERLLNLLSFFEPLEVSKVPFISILREFIGGNIYHRIQKNDARIAPDTSRL
jgi:uridine kinase